MTEEGVIKYRLDHRPAAGVDHPLLPALQEWRTRLQALGMLGQDPRRYDGYAFGNLSVRLAPVETPAGRRAFLISGSQTAGAAHVDANAWARVYRYDFEHFRLWSEGPVQPSSEALTHAAVYELDTLPRVVFHVHSPEIWERSATLGLPVTDPDAAFGSREMVAEVKRLNESGALRNGVFAMGGHRDGIIAFAHTPENAGQALLALTVN